jgi:hypothetical protein
MRAALESLGFTVDLLLNAGQEQMESAAMRLRSRLSAEGRNGLFTTHLLANLKTPGLSV